MSLAFSMSLRTDPFRIRSTSFSVGLPRTAYVFVCGMSVLDDISCHFNSVAPSKQNRNAISTRLSVKKPMRCQFKPQGEQKKWCLHRYHSRNYASIAFCLTNSFVFSTYFNACVIGIPHCDITNFNSPKPAKASRLVHI